VSVDAFVDAWMKFRDYFGDPGDPAVATLFLAYQVAGLRAALERMAEFEEGGGEE
jgi:hypothetical protein